MPLDTHDGRQRLEPPLYGRLPPDAGAERIGAAIVELWREIDEVLCPIIGHRGVAALFQRSLKLVEQDHPWLGTGQTGMLDPADLSALKATLSQRDAAEAVAGGAAQLGAFRTLLASLIGDSLTDRLLRSVWSPPAGDPPAQDTAS